MMPDAPVPTIDFSALQSTGARPYDDEGLFARDVDGQLIRVEKATANDFDTDVHLRIDGQSLVLKKAVPQRDSQGNIIRDAQGQPVPRYSTIYDAATEAFVHQPGDLNPIPTLCHKEHLPPVGVCRVCVVEVTETTRRGPMRKLVPACVQRASEGMEIHTLASTADPEAAARVRAATRTIVELLVADHLPTTNGVCQTTDQAGAGNELAELAQRLDITRSRFAPLAINRGQDHTSLMIAVDHNQCILCGRCQRGCDWLKHNNVIGRSGKGYASVISFDLGLAMGDSSCVSCGECAVSCPTGAL
ncbi:MAG TPA: 4Fe-4S dicluster domain-containing protein, partial [Pirellulaceae bacterium]